MTYNARVLADSLSPDGFRVTTLEATMPRFILAELNTHRMLSRGTASSRAIPVELRIASISTDLFVPESFGKNRRGMQADEDLEGEYAEMARNAWQAAADDAVKHARTLAAAGAHKQIANRVIEPFVWSTSVITSTEWENWDALRVSKLAQPEMFKIAGIMREVRLASKPIDVGYGAWHLPYVRTDDENHFAAEFDMRVLNIDPVRVSVGRCAAVSYNRNSDQTDMRKDEQRTDDLIKNGHMSPLEHALRPMSKEELDAFAHDEYRWNAPLNKFMWTGRQRHFLGNVEGWVQFRKMVPGEDVYRG